MPLEGLLAYHGHGSIGGDGLSCWNGSSFSDLKANGTNGGSNYYVSSLSSGSLNKLIVAVYTACETAKTIDSSPDSLLQQTLNKGAKCAIGFFYEIAEPPAGLWHKCFSTALYQGKTISQAIAYADIEVKKV